MDKTKKDVINALPGYVTIVRISMNYNNGTILPDRFNG